MAFSDNVLPREGWTFTGDSYFTTDNMLHIGAAGSAQVTCDVLGSSNMIPDSLQVNLNALSYGDAYVPSAFAYITIVYDDDTVFSSCIPIIDIMGGISTIITCNTAQIGSGLSAFKTFTFKVVSTGVLNLTRYEVCKESVEALQENVPYAGVTISSRDGLIITATNNAARVQLSQNRMEFLVNKAGNLVPVFEIDIPNKKAKMSGDIYATRFLAGDMSDPSVDVKARMEITQSGMSMYDDDNIKKFELGYANNDANSPFIALGLAQYTLESTRALIRYYPNGIWIGNGNPLARQTTAAGFDPHSGDSGLFFCTRTGTGTGDAGNAYIVRGTEMKNLYVGDAVAVFG